jgi:chromosome segregation ATPase
MPGHGHRVFIETDRSGTPQFVRRPSSADQYRRPRVDGIYISRGDLDNMQDRERYLRDAYDRCLQQNHELKEVLQNKERECQTLRVHVHNLELENRDLRQSVGGIEQVEARYKDKNYDLRKKNKHLEHETESLRARIRELTRQIKEAVDNRVRILKEEVRAVNKDVGEWRRRYEDLSRRHERMGKNLDAHVESNHRLKEENKLLHQSLEIEDRLRRRREYI